MLSVVMLNVTMLNSVAPGTNLIKLSTDVVYKFSELAIVLVIYKPFQPSLVFEVKAGAYLNEASFMCSTKDRLLALPTNIRIG